LPVIVTPNTGASEIVENGREAFVVPICRSDAIVECLSKLDRDRNLLAAMARQAQVTAARNSWDSYRVRWAEAVRGVS
jgi:alpha-maltose-1-phosphate synthase